MPCCVRMRSSISGEYASRTLSIENQRDAAILRRNNHELIFRDDKAEATQFRHLIKDKWRELIELDAGRNFSAQGQPNPQPRLREVRWDAVEHKRPLAVRECEFGHLRSSAGRVSSVIQDIHDLVRLGIDDADGVFLNHIAVIAVVGEDCKYCCRHRKEPYAARNAGPDAPCELHARNPIAIDRERLAQASALIRGQLCPLLPQLFVPCGDWLVGPGTQRLVGAFWCPVLLRRPLSLFATLTFGCLPVRGALFISLLCLLVRSLLFRRATLFCRLPLHSPQFFGSLSALGCALLFYAATLLLLLNGPLAGGSSLFCGTLLFCRPTTRGFVCTCRCGGRGLRGLSSRPVVRRCVRARPPR